MYRLFVTNDVQVAKDEYDRTLAAAREKLRKVLEEAEKEY